MYAVGTRRQSLLQARMWRKKAKTVQAATAAAATAAAARMAVVPSRY